MLSSIKSSCISTIPIQTGCTLCTPKTVWNCSIWILSLPASLLVKRSLSNSFYIKRRLKHPFCSFRPAVHILPGVLSFSDYFTWKFYPFSFWDYICIEKKGTKDKHWPMKKLFCHFVIITWLIFAIATCD